MITLQSPVRADVGDDGDVRSFRGAKSDYGPIHICRVSCGIFVGVTAVVFMSYGFGLDFGECGAMIAERMSVLASERVHRKRNRGCTRIRRKQTNHGLHEFHG